jgi:hypothetical protein
VVRVLQNQSGTECDSDHGEIIRAIHAVYCSLACSKNRNACLVHLLAMFASFIPKREFNAIPESKFIVDGAKVVLHITTNSVVPTARAISLFFNP